MEATDVKELEQAKTPSAIKVLLKELYRDKLALVSLIFLVLVAAFVYGLSIFLDHNSDCHG